MVNHENTNAAAKSAAANPSTQDNEATTSPTPPTRTPFTSLSQVDADLALARTLQEQERAYMMLCNGGEDSGYVTSESGTESEMDSGDPNYGFGDEDGDVHETDFEEDAFDAMDRDLDPEELDSVEDDQRIMQEGVGRELAARLMSVAGLNGWTSGGHADRNGIDQDAWEDVDPDELTYEELIALGEVVGTESRGLSAEKIACLPSVTSKAQSEEDGSIDQCVICRMEYEDGESLLVLPCKHLYHSECINKWLQINKVCPICSAEVSMQSQPDHKPI